MLAFAPGEQRAAAAPQRTAPQRVPQAPMLQATAPAPQGATAASRATAPAPRPESKKNPPDIPWPEWVEQLGLSGMARMLAQHCELVSSDATRVELKIAQSHQHLLDGPYQDRLKAALEQYLGGRLKLVIQLADSAGASPAAIADRDKQQRQAQAVAAIEKDPFVRELVDTFDARIVGSSIKPLQ
jgi:DNA polymerase-3 subunit gamma/tau